MSIDYARAKRRGPGLKATLTRAMNRPESERYAAVLAACRAAVVEWSAWGAWPDNWHRWQRALDDAAFKAHTTPPSLEDFA
jgi:hypothetical protein